jgi:hypothetical protein
VSVFTANASKQEQDVGKNCDRCTAAGCIATAYIAAVAIGGCVDVPNVHKTATFQYSITFAV